MYRCLDQDEVMQVGDIFVYDDGDEYVIGEGWAGDTPKDICGWAGSVKSYLYWPHDTSTCTVAVLRLE